MKVTIFCPPELLTDPNFLPFLVETFQPFLLDSPPHQILCDEANLHPLAEQLSKLLNLQYIFGPYEPSYSSICVSNGVSCGDLVASAGVTICVLEQENESTQNVLISDYSDYSAKYKDLETPGEFPDEPNPQSHIGDSSMKSEDPQGLRVLAAYWRDLPEAPFLSFLFDLLRQYGHLFNVVACDGDLKYIADQLQGEKVTQGVLSPDICGSGRAFLDLPGPGHWILLCKYPILKAVLDPTSESVFILVQENRQITTHQLADFEDFCKQLTSASSPGLELSPSPIRKSEKKPYPPLEEKGNSRPDSSNRRVRRKPSVRQTGLSTTRPMLEDDSQSEQTQPPIEEVRQSGQLKRRKLEEARLVAESQGEIKAIRVLVGCREDWTEESEANLALFLSNWKVQFYLCYSNPQFAAVASKLQCKLVSLAQEYVSSGTAFMNMPADENFVFLASWPLLQQIVSENQWPENTFLVYRINNCEIQPYVVPETPRSRPQSRPKPAPIRPTSADVYASKLLKQTEEIASHREKQLQSLQATLKSRLERVQCRAVPSPTIATTRETAAALLVQSLDALLAFYVGKLTELCTELQQSLGVYTESLVSDLKAPMLELHGLLAALPSQALQGEVLQLHQLRKAYEDSKSNPVLDQALTQFSEDETALYNRLLCTVEVPHYPYALTTAKLQGLAYLVVRTKRPSGQTPVVFMKTDPYLQITVQNWVYLDQEVLFIPLALSPGAALTLSLWENQENQVSKPIFLSSADFQGLEDLNWESGAEQFEANQYELGRQTS